MLTRLTSLFQPLLLATTLADLLPIMTLFHQMFHPLHQTETTSIHQEL